MTRTTPELAPSLQTSAPHQRDHGSQKEKEQESRGAKRSPAGVVRKLEERVPAQESSSSSDRGSKLREKGNSHWAIVRKSDANALACLVMVPSPCMTIPRLLAKLKNCCKSSCGKSGATFGPDLAPNWAPNTYIEQGSLQTVMSKQPPRTGSKGRDVISTKLG
ncbi:hypothetical protein AVEN_39467-1 [Araneus ventricosus]|uniref:Uncharacterized protein n=1 Tax=Araneus ventricosus TaxID=182803 RepID=A0A4Y2D7N1_ARAVE|nr:hypothetical protein AVEN_39467-1 [Araneus ventricosus]